MNAKGSYSILFLAYLSFAFAFNGIASEFVVDPKVSSLSVSVNATGDNFTAHLEKFDSKITVQKETGQPVQGTFSWDFKDLKTGKKGRDKEMLRWLDYDHSPKGTFTLTKCEEISGEAHFSGDVKIHNTTRQVSFPVALIRQGDRVSYDGEFTLDHRDYSLEPIVKMVILKVSPVLKIHFKLDGTIRD